MPTWQTDGNPDVHINANSFLGTIADDPLRIRTNSDTKYVCIMTDYAKDNKARATPGLK